MKSLELLPMATVGSIYSTLSIRFLIILSSVLNNGLWIPPGLDLLPILANITGTTGLCITAKYPSWQV